MGEIKSMRKLRNITLLEYSQIKNKGEYDLLVKSIKPSNTISLKVGSKFIVIHPKFNNVWDCSYGDIIELKEAFADGDEEASKAIYKIFYGIRDYSNVSVLSVNNIKWVAEQFEELLKVEKEELSYSPTQKEKNAGIDELNKFGFYPSIDTLTGGDMSKESEFLQMPYSRVFQKLCYNKTINTIHSKLYEYDSK